MIRMPSVEIKTMLLNFWLFLIVKTCRYNIPLNKEQKFLDVTIKNDEKCSYDFTVHRKPALTNVLTKPHPTFPLT